MNWIYYFTLFGICAIFISQFYLFGVLIFRSFGLHYEYAKYLQWLFLASTIGVIYQAIRIDFIPYFGETQLATFGSCLASLVLWYYVLVDNYPPGDTWMTSLEQWFFIFVGYVFSLSFLIFQNFLLIFGLLEACSVLLYGILAHVPPNASLERKKQTTYAALQYLFFSSLGGILFAQGCLHTAIQYGTLEFSELRVLCLSHSEYALNVPVILFCFGLLLKLGTGTFWTWIPDVYAGSSRAAFYYVSTVGKLPPLFATCATFSAFPYYNTTLLGICIFVVYSLLSPSYLIIVQYSLRRILAYSSIINLGWLFLMVAAKVEFYNVVFFFACYVLALFTIYIGFSEVDEDVFYGGQEHKDHVKTLADISGAGCFSITMGFLFLSGMPILGIFFAKIIVASTLASENSYLFILYILIFLFYSFSQIFAYLNVVKYSFNFLRKNLSNVIVSGNFDYKRYVLRTGLTVLFSIIFLFCIYIWVSLFNLQN